MHQSPDLNYMLYLYLGYNVCGGTVGAIFTCPLEVIKTRLQSSKLAFRAVYYPQVQLGTISGEGMVRPTSVSPGLFSVLKSILEKEGPRSLFRGLGPNLVGVAPSRAVYFACYSKAKEQFNGIFVPNSNIVHICSAGSAAFVTNSLMNPIWMVKTRMQLERKVRGSKPMNALQCARYVYQTEGIRGFYRGLTASYAGISETIICFAIYESLKKHLKEELHKLLWTDVCCCCFQGLCFLYCLSTWYVNFSIYDCRGTAVASNPRQMLGFRVVKFLAV
uniref:Solute carrier family 25 member 33 n=1 Tax=Anas platyrhynchos platyrhynchos TaxID=8840 RepID=A0A493TER3_ANAPP